MGSFDLQLLEWINVAWSHSILDWIMPMIRNKLIWVPVYVVIISYVLENYDFKIGIIILLGLASTVSLADMVSSRVVKPAIQRVRPCNDHVLSDRLIHRMPCGQGYSFTSSHAANHFALSTILLGFFRRRWSSFVPLIICWPVLVCLAQLYVGLHYPSDVLFGALLGIFVGSICYKVFSKIISQISTKDS